MTYDGMVELEKEQWAALVLLPAVLVSLESENVGADWGSAGIVKRSPTGRLACSLDSTHPHQEPRPSICRTTSVPRYAAHRPGILGMRLVRIQHQEVVAIVTLHFAMVLLPRRDKGEELLPRRDMGDEPLAQRRAMLMKDVDGESAGVTAGVAPGVGMSDEESI